MAQDLVNGGSGAGNTKTAAARVVPAIPLAFGGKRKNKAKAETPGKIVAAEETFAAPADTAAVKAAAVEEVAEEVGSTETRLDTPEQQNKLAEDSAANQEVKDSLDVDQPIVEPALELQHDELNGVTPDSSIRESVPPSQDSDTTVEGQAQADVPSKATNASLHQTSHSIKSPVVFGGHIDPDVAIPEPTPPPVTHDHRLVDGERPIPSNQTFVPPTTRAPPGLQYAVQSTIPQDPHRTAPQYMQPSHTYSQPYAPVDSFAAPSLSNGLPYPTHQDFSHGRPEIYQQSRPAAYNPQAPVYTRPQASMQAHHAPVNGFTPHDSIHERQARNSFSQIEQDRRRSSVPTNGDTPALRPDAQPMPSNLDRDTGVAQFIHSQFGSAEFADYILRLAFPPQYLPAHGIILARSPRLRSLMAMPPQFYNGSYPRLLDVHITDRFLTHDLAFMKALMRLYGEAFPDGNWVLSMSAAQAPHASQHEAMRFSLSYAAAGHFLQVEDIVMAGLSLSASILTWETMPMYLAFALDGGLGAAFGSSYETASSDSSSHDGNGTPSKQLESPSSSPTYGIYSDRAVHNLLGFLVHHWPSDFKFDESAPQFPEIARLPSTSEPPSRHNRHTSRMSQIRFGEMTREEEGGPTNIVHTTLSSVLLTLPFSLLAHIFGNNILGQRFGWNKTTELMHAVVNEREQRRTRAVQSRKSAPPGLPLMAEDRLWNNTRWVEALESSEQHPAKCRLVRHLTSSEAPSALPSVDGGSVSSS